MPSDLRTPLNHLIMHSCEILTTHAWVSPPSSPSSPSPSSSLSNIYMITILTTKSLINMARIGEKFR